MIAKFPERPSSKTTEKSFTIVREKDEIFEDEQNCAWVHWLFQRLRGLCPELFFSPSNTLKNRKELIEEWQYFVRGSWNTILAPGILQTLKLANEQKLPEILVLGDKLKFHWGPSEWTKSCEIGTALLEVTAGAKYQGVLGQFRTFALENKAPSHLPIVWGLLANLFQLTPRDALESYLREEWRAATRFERSFEREPLGEYSLQGVVLRNLKQERGEGNWLR